MLLEHISAEFAQIYRDVFYYLAADDESKHVDYAE